MRTRVRNQKKNRLRLWWQQAQAVYYAKDLWNRQVIRGVEWNSEWQMCDETRSHLQQYTSIDIHNICSRRQDSVFSRHRWVFHCVCFLFFWSTFLVNCFTHRSGTFKLTKMLFDWLYFIVYFFYSWLLLHVLTPIL